MEVVLSTQFLRSMM